MGQVNRVVPFNLAGLHRGQDREQPTAGCDRLRKEAESAEGWSRAETVAMPPPVPQSWPRVFPGL